jgi:tol-pal system protein YbgF
VNLSSYRFLPFSLFFVTILLSTNSMSQAEIRDSNATDSSHGTTSAANDSSVVYEVQALQQEVLSLRGQLETLEYEIKRLKKQRLDDYLDLDKRVSELTRQLSAAPTVPVVPQVPIATTVTGGTPAITEPVAAVNGEQANALYNDAINLLLNQQDYQGAQTKFTEYLTAYPNGQYTPNVYYWQGQILLSDAKKQKAATHFLALIEQYPSHQKVPDAKFKLARIYFDSGKKEQAKKLLDDVALSGSDAALLAKSFITKHY